MDMSDAFCYEMFLNKPFWSFIGYSGTAIKTCLSLIGTGILPVVFVICYHGKINDDCLERSDSCFSFVIFFLFSSRLILYAY